MNLAFNISEHEMSISFISMTFSLIGTIASKRHNR